MENSIIGQFSCNYKHIIIDEIALEGLEGISFELLWRRAEKRLSACITEKMKSRYWRFIVNYSSFKFYVIPEPFLHLEIVDRFTLVDESTGHLAENEDYLDGPYEYNPIDNDYGSCKHYYTRKPVTNLASLTYTEAMSNYGDTLVVVASIEDRWHALAPHMPMTYLYQMLPANFCLLELVGRARDNGQMSVGKTNVSKITKDSKTLFYIRKHLQNRDLVKVQNITQVIKGKGFKCLLLRLKRFHKPEVLSFPKIGTVHDVLEYLLNAPGNCERTELLVKKGVLTQKQNRRLQKTVNIFNFEDRAVTVHIPNSKSKKPKLTQKRRYIVLSPKSDESSASDDEVYEPVLVSKYKVGIGIMRQAYDLFVEAGLQGLTQVQLSFLLGVEFYTARTICRTFRTRKIVREYLEDKGKQRTGRFVAVVATDKMDKTYEEQRLKFLAHLERCKSDEREPAAVLSSDDELPLKRIKLEQETNNIRDVDINTTPNNSIIEMKVLEGYNNAKSLDSFQKNPTLRQLKFANSLLNILKEKLCVSGYMTLSNLAAKEINEAPLDTKALKSFIQKLLTDGHIKMYKIIWPGMQRCTILICAHHIKITDPIITAKYKEICLRAVISKKENPKKEIIANPVQLPVRQSYPRYMKIKKLHEFLMNITYFDIVKPESHTLPQGFVSVIDLYPEATVEFLINNVCTSVAMEMYQIVDDSQLKLKLKHTPTHVYTTLIKSMQKNTIRLNLKVLAMLGLIQLVSYQTAVTNEPGLSNNSNFLFYVNRRAQILNTSGTWPRSTPEAKVLSYYFEFPDDVTKYWSEVFTISTATDIIVSQRSKKMIQAPLRKASEVHKYDTGLRFGDGCGPCGFDSGFYMDMARLWQPSYDRTCRKKVPKKKLKMPRFKKVKVKPKPRAPTKRIVQRPPPIVKQRRRTDATVKFSKHEDLIITVCKAAITIMSPTSQPGTLIIRNTVAKDLLSINDPRKTKGVCHRRALTIDNKVSLIHEKQCIINELRRRRELILKYEGLLKKLRMKYSTNMSKFITKCRLPMLELVWIILQLIQCPSYNQRLPCVAVSLENFNSHFSITTSTANKLCNLYKLSENSPLREAIILTVMQTMYDDIDTETSKSIYTTFNAYPESALRITVDQLRNCSAIAAKEKILNSQIRKRDLEDISQSAYKISMFYKRRWICRLNADFVEKVGDILDTVQSEMAIKGSPEINCAICELGACGLMEIKATTIPLLTDANGIAIEPGQELSALTIDTNYNLSTGAMTWKRTGAIKVSDLYEMNEKDLNDSLELLSRFCRVDDDTINTCVLELNGDIILYLNQKGERGATFAELQDVVKYETRVLTEKLLTFQSKGIIKRVGFYENVIILTTFFKSWSTKFGEQYIICTPWLKLKSGLHIDVFLSWSGAAMNIIFEKPGATIAYIADKLEFITYRALQDIYEFLEKYKCVKLKIVKMPVVDLFSDDSMEPEFCHYIPFWSPEEIIVLPTQNCITQYANVRKRIVQMYSIPTEPRSD